MTAFDQELVYRVTPARPSECSCGQCRAMCRRTICLGTPADILELVHHGHAGDLQATLWAVADIHHPIPMVQLRATAFGCVKLDHGRCTIHAYKPTEGALASHTFRHSLASAPSFAVALTWLSPRNRKLVAHLLRIVQQPKTEPILL